MEETGKILFYLLFLVVGFCSQYLVRWSPRVNLAVSYLLVLILPPSWSFGLVAGIWVSCAFLTFNPEKERRLDMLPAINWSKVIFASIWAFMGFILTLLFLWKLKITNSLDLSQREMFAWSFLILVEICFYKIIARGSPKLYRIPLGYGMALLNFLMILYWIFPFGTTFMILILASLLIINPILLILVDRPMNQMKDPFFRSR